MNANFLYLASTFAFIFLTSAAFLTPLAVISFIEILPVKVVVSIASLATLTVCLVIFFHARAPLAAEVNLQRAQRAVTMFMGLLLASNIYPIPKLEIVHDDVSVRYVVVDSFRLSETGLIHLYWLSLLFIIACVILNLVNDILKQWR